MSQLLQAHGWPSSKLRHAVLGKVHRAEEGEVDSPYRADHVLVTAESPSLDDCAGYAGLLTSTVLPDGLLDLLPLPTMHGALQLDHLKAGDVVALRPSGLVRTLYRKGSPHNSLFVTAQCNSYCLMCSQPPIPVDDRERIQEHLRLLELIDPETPELGMTGGEPTLFKRDFLRIVERSRDLLPKTALHILSNGRLFYYGSFARALAAIEHPDLMVGIPLYSDLDFTHDFVVQAAGAFDQTLIGIQNLGRYGVPVEIRVVIHRLTAARLPRLVEFVYRNLPFAAHVALMGLEMTGFTIPNLEALWIDPIDYSRELVEATTFLAARGMSVSVYNHQLCVVPREIWTYCRRSISDWKNDYLPECRACDVRRECGGFFSSALKKRTSRAIRPIQAPPRSTA